MLEAKNDEIVTLSGDCNQHDALLHESEAVVQPTSTANAEVRLNSVVYLTFFRVYQIKSRQYSKS
jgi:hypothetical protein